jgi:hypothetical protein
MIQETAAGRHYLKIACEDTSAAPDGCRRQITASHNLPVTCITYLSLFIGFLSILQKNISPGN